MTDVLQYLKTNYEVVLMVTGIFLILIGLVIFVTGRFSDKESHVEGFGIKMDVKNPSLILIVLGVFLVVAPMLSGPSPRPVPDEPGKTEPGKTEPGKSAPGKTAPGKGSLPPAAPGKNPPPSNPAPQKPPEAPQQLPPSAPPKPRAKPLPAITGLYELASFLTNGVPLALAGTMEVGAPQARTFPFRAVFIDPASGGNVWYVGYFRNDESGWYLAITQSNDPQVWSGEIPMGLSYTEYSGLLELRYVAGGQVGITWHRSQ